jgi:hypothetical protein
MMENLKYRHYESASNHESYQADGIPQAEAKTSASDGQISWNQ